MLRKFLRDVIWSVGAATLVLATIAAWVSVLVLFGFAVADLLLRMGVA